MSRTGRRPGTLDTRATILSVAKEKFATRGYDATSLRSIAADAGVDPALIVHYFATKEGLFVAAMGLPGRPSELLGDLTTMPIDEAARAIVRTYLTIVDSDDSRNAVLSLVRSAVSNERAASMLREFLTNEFVRVIASLSTRRDASLRASLAVAQLIGIAMLRHVVRADAVTSAEREELVRLVAPVIESYLG